MKNLLLIPFLLVPATANADPQSFVTIPLDETRYRSVINSMADTPLKYALPVINLLSQLETEAVKESRLDTSSQKTPK